jgi:Flp pilus assembly protein TadD/uncharacterized protein (AIM24 family)
MPRDPDPLATWPLDALQGGSAAEDRLPSGGDALELGPFLLHRNKGREAFEAQEFARARRDLDLAHRIRPDDPEVLYWLAMTLFRLDQYAEAERVFARLIEIKPGVPTLQVNRGIVLYKMGRAAEAEALFRAALALGGAGNRPQLYLGLIAARRGETRDAIRHFDAAGAEVMAARMRERLTSTPGLSSPPPPGFPLQPTTDLPSLPGPVPGLEQALGAAQPGEVVRRDAAFTPYGRFLVEVAFRGMIFVRRGAIAAYVGELQYDAAAEEEELLRTSGEGRVVLASEGRRLAIVPLDGGNLHVELSHFVACEQTLSRELVSLGRRDGLGLRAISMTGTGLAVVATGGAPLVVPLAPEVPVCIAADMIVGWSGALEPALVRQGSLEDRALRGPGGALKLRFRGQGQLILDHRREDGL